MQSASKRLSHCRLCGGAFYSAQLSLPPTPPANRLGKTMSEATDMVRFPLDVVMCQECKHLQLRDIVDSQILYSDYVYKSGTSRTFVEHFTQLAAEIKLLAVPNNFIVEVGSNDGTLLDALGGSGFETIGIEPSLTLVNEANTRNRNTFHGFFNTKTMTEIVKQKGKPGVIIGNNVFAHIDDLNEAFECAALHIDIDGYFIFEVADVSKILTSGIFDTIYHEHMSYHSVITLRKFSDKHGFVITRIDKIETHGGSLRFFLRKNKYVENTSIVESIIVDEEGLGLDNDSSISNIKKQIEMVKKEALQLMEPYISNPNVRLIGYGAPAKVVTFLAALEFESLNLQGIVDDNEFKQGKYLPGSGIPIVSSIEMQREIIENSTSQEIVCLVFPWNLGPEVISKLKTWLPKGSSIISFFPTIRKVVT